MDSVEGNLRNILQGRSSNERLDLCDFTLRQQNEATIAQGVSPSAPSDYVPVVQETVTYVVMAVLFNEQNEVLLMQEAKRSCAGEWYLPAGRMEPGETIEEAVKREVREETGLDFEPVTLIAVEIASKAWFRFVLTGRVTGGRLKTVAQADAESLQAKWVANPREMSLRSNDMLLILDTAREYLGLPPAEAHPALLPTLNPCSRLLLRLIIVISPKKSNNLHVLLSEKTAVHFPLCEINHERSLLSTLRKFMVEIFGADVAVHKPHGVVQLEHYGKQREDGLCITMLVSFRVPLEEVFPIDKYTWFMVSRDLDALLRSRLPKNMCVPLKVIR